MPSRASRRGDLGDVVAMAEAERGGAEHVAAGARPRARRRRRRRVRAGQRADQLVEGLGRAPVLLLLVGRQLQRHDRDRQAQRLGEAAGIVLDQLGGAGRADQHRLRLEALVGVARRGLEQLGRVAAEVARLEGRVGDRRALGAALDHREQQVGVGVALRRVQHVVHALHRGGDAHRADMRRAFVGPDGELHGLRPPAARGGSAAARTARPEPTSASRTSVSTFSSKQRDVSKA